MTPARLAAAIFDVDGTLVDSERDGHRVAFNRAFERLGMSDRWDVETYGELLSVAGGRRRLVHYLRTQGHSGSDAEELAGRLHSLKTDIMRDLVCSGAVPSRPGAQQLLEELSHAGVDLYVATTGSRAWVEPLLDQHFATVDFKAVLTGSEVTSLKPDPAVYLEVLRRSGHETRSCLAVEDSGPGVSAAVAAGLRCLAVTNDYTIEHDLSAAAFIGTGLDDPAVLDWLFEQVEPGAEVHR